MGSYSGDRGIKYYMFSYTPSSSWRSMIRGREAAFPRPTCSLFLTLIFSLSLFFYLFIIHYAQWVCVYFCTLIICVVNNKNNIVCDIPYFLCTTNDSQLCHLLQLVTIAKGHSCNQGSHLDNLPIRCTYNNIIVLCDCITYVGMHLLRSSEKKNNNNLYT